MVRKRSPATDLSSEIRKYSTLVIICGILAAVAVALPETRRVEATASGALQGYAWSDTIGWISLSGSNYGLTIDTGGTVSGYAWSDNIGWISANQSELTGCPSNPCRAKFNGSSLTGWMKALAGGTSYSGGWDGWISLSGSNYGVSESNGTISGYAWGSDVVGWLDFSAATPFGPSATLSAAPTTITRGQYTDVTWTSANATSCTGTNFTTNNTTSGTVRVFPNDTTIYGGSCTGAGGTSAFNNVTVTVQCPVSYSCNGNVIQRTDASCVTTDYLTCTSPTFCSIGSSVCLVPPITFTPVGEYTGHLELRPEILRAGETTRVHWRVENAESCTVTGTNGDSWNGASSGTSGRESSPIFEPVTFTLHCVGYDGASPPDIDETATVIVLPDFQEQ